MCDDKIQFELTFIRVGIYASLYEEKSNYDTVLRSNTCYENS